MGELMRGVGLNDRITWIMNVTISGLHRFTAAYTGMDSRKQAGREWVDGMGG